MQFWAVVVDSFRESLDRKIFWVMVAISCLIAATMVCVGIESDRLTFFFGLWEIETSHYNPFSGLGRSHLVGLVVYVLLDMFLGWGGMILMLIATAGMLPAMMERGGIDVLLAKPISRPRLFVYKYLATMVFALAQATLFIGLTFLVMGLRWKVWVPGYLLGIPLIVLLFSYVYCVSVLVAVKTRSTIAAVLLSVGAWVFFAVPPIALDVLDEIPALRENEKIYRGIKLAAWIPPKTMDIPYLAAKWAGAGTYIDMLPRSILSDAEVSRDVLDRARESEQRELDKNPWVSIGSSLLFEAVIVVWATAVFVRKDY